MNSNELLDALKAHTGKPSDYALAREVLKVDQNSLKEMRVRGLSDARAIQIANTLGLNVGEVLASIHAERSKDPKVRRVWAKIALTLRSAAAMLVVALSFSATFAPSPAHADASAAPNTVYYVKL